MPSSSILLHGCFLVSTLFGTSIPTSFNILNGFQEIRKFSIYTVATEVAKILLVKDHAHKEKESFHVKPKESTCATFAVGQFNSKVLFG